MTRHRVRVDGVPRGASDPQDVDWLDPERHYEVDDTVNWTIPVTMRRRGHVPPIPSGAMVRIVHKSILVTSCLDAPYEALDDPNVFLRLDEAVHGLVVERVWHADLNELKRGELDPVIDSRRIRPHVRNVNVDLYYRVMFPRGLFWARYDWLEEVPIDGDKPEASQPG